MVKEMAKEIASIGLEWRLMLRENIREMEARGKCE